MSTRPDPSSTRGDMPDVLQAVVVEHQFSFTLVDLARASRADVQWLRALVEEGALSAEGEAPTQWRFAGDALPRVRRAARLARDFELAPAQLALVIDLVDEIDALRRRLRDLGR